MKRAISRDRLALCLSRQPEIRSIADASRLAQWPVGFPHLPEVAVIEPAAADLRLSQIRFNSSARCFSTGVSGPDIFETSLSWRIQTLRAKPQKEEDSNSLLLCRPLRLDIRRVSRVFCDRCRICSCTGITMPQTTFERLTRREREIMPGAVFAYRVIARRLKEIRARLTQPAPAIPPFVSCSQGSKKGCLKHQQDPPPLYLHSRHNLPRLSPSAPRCHAVFPDVLRRLAPTDDDDPRG